MTTATTERDLELELTDCPLCGSDKRLFLHAFPPYGVVQCDRCNLCFLSPRLPEEAMINIYHSQEYFSQGEHGYQNYQSQEKALRATFRKFLNTLKKQNQTGGHLLEVGCAYGYFLDEAQPFFKQRAGLDFSTDTLAHAKTYGAHTFQGGVRDLPADEYFDCIIALHVIEHVYDPYMFLRDLSRHLQPGGSIILATPYIGGFWYKWMDKNWPSFKVPEHILYFDKKTLKRLMEKAGLRQIREVEYPHAFPLSLVGEKLGLPVPGFLQDINVWIPGTTIAMSGVLSKHA